jgi:UDP-N-acetylmuramoyl-tripeptide--D-alanyl-D-alanine ligase
METLYNAYIRSSGICIDSRKVTPNCLFFCLKGDRFNGNDFALEAIQQGALFAIVDEDRNWKSAQVIRVADCLKTLQDLALFHRKLLHIPVIGLTGSNGKTTTKELFREVLSEKYQVRATIGNLNNHIGVPLSILSITKQDEIAIIEMGANAQKEIEFLASISLPSIGYITNFGLAHLEGFGGEQGVIKGKSELYENLRFSQSQVLVNIDDPLQLKNTEGMSRVLFGSTADSPYTIQLENPSKNISVRWQGHLIQSQLTGAYNFSNIAAAISVGVLFEVPSKNIIHALENYAPKNHRSQWQKGNFNALIVDCYNANPSSMSLALDNLQLQTQPTAAILGDMFELGEYSQNEHQKIIDHAVQLNIDTLIFVGDHFARCKIPQTAHCFKTTQEAMESLKNHPIKEHTVLIKGSRGMALENVLSLL